MGFYRSIPTVKEAFQLTRKIADVIIVWIGEANIGEYNTGEFAEDSCYIQIKTLEGVMTAEEEDWIIKGVNGEFYPCKDDVFRKSYEACIDANT